MPKLATIRTADGTRAVRLDGDRHVDLGFSDVGAFLAAGSPDVPKDSATYAVEGADFAPVVPNPSKVVCVGLNYRSHIEEMGRDLPEHPVLFAKFADTLAGANDDVVKPAETDQLDWECELTIVIGRTVRRADEAEAAGAIAGFTAANDYSVRDWQFRTREWLQGKVWEATTPVGPYVVTPEELPGGVRPSLDTELTVNGVVKQTASTSDLLFDPVHLVQYLSTITTLRPGDLILTGTNGGVGHARSPQEFLVGGETVQITVQGIGTITNHIVKR
ncbi:fumarylacetoacetate hydrolase family protein [Acrocarpospora catenulata]|uniref:fumarylacetoacetate hydrolase family protein n=1 Tax=Acrocarpospora catenulata TaxID=2836182 RepID=UPI001BD98572|nr:fumarylacetoacetate hydrolase family protein [Acrocarpospora catenulata]